MFTIVRAPGLKLETQLKSGACLGALVKRRVEPRSCFVVRQNRSTCETPDRFQMILLEKRKCVQGTAIPNTRCMNVDQMPLRKHTRGNSSRYPGSKPFKHAPTQFNGKRICSSSYHACDVVNGSASGVFFKSKARTILWRYADYPRCIWGLMNRPAALVARARTKPDMLPLRQ
jgi:hypothetical protein